MAIGQIHGGAFQDGGGNVLAYGSLTLQLSHDAMVTGGSAEVVSGVLLRFALDVTGSVQLTNIWFNSSLTPIGTAYTANIYNKLGVLVRGPEVWVLTGGSPIDLGTLVPTSAGALYPAMQGGRATYVSGGTLTVSFSPPFHALTSVVGTSVAGTCSLASASASSATFTTTNDVWWLAFGT